MWWSKLKNCEQTEQKPSRISCNAIARKSAQDFQYIATTYSDKKVVSIDFNAAVVDPEDTETLSDISGQAINAAIEERWSRRLKTRCVHREIAILKKLE